MKITYILLSVLIFLFSCGPSREEIENEIKMKGLEWKMNPLNFLDVKLTIKETSIFEKNKLRISLFNKDDNRRIKNILVRVHSYAKTDADLGYHDEMIYDFIEPNSSFNRDVNFDKFHPETKSWKNAKIIQAEFE